MVFDTIYCVVGVILLLQYLMIFGKVSAMMVVPRHHFNMVQQTNIKLKTNTVGGIPFFLKSILEDSHGINDVVPPKNFISFTDNGYKDFLKMYHGF